MQLPGLFRFSLDWSGKVHHVNVVLFPCWRKEVLVNVKKLLLVMNPCAGQRKARKYLADIIDIFNRAGYMVTTHITEHSGDGEAAVIRCVSEIDVIVCCGGDGTFNETIKEICFPSIAITSLSAQTFMPMGVADSWVTSR